MFPHATLAHTQRRLLQIYSFKFEDCIEKDGIVGMLMRLEQPKNNKSEEERKVKDVLR